MVGKRGGGGVFGLGWVERKAFFLLSLCSVGEDGVLFPMSLDWRDIYNKESGEEEEEGRERKEKNITK